MAATNRESSSFPPVVLDTTLFDLLSAEKADGDELEAICTFKPNSDPKFGKAVPLSDKFIIHSAQTGGADDLAHLQLENTCHLLLFFVGAMDVIFIAADGNSDDPTLKLDVVDENAKRSFSVIQESQRPRVSTFGNREDAVKRYKGKKIRWGFGLDMAEDLPYLFHPELIYKLNSKRWLADCDLKSANDRLLDSQVKCSSHSTKDGLWYSGGSSCKECEDSIKKEVERIRNVLQDTKAPYVLKLTQSAAAVGTMIVQEEDDKKETIDKAADFLENFLPRVTEKNAHLYTTTLILSEFIPGPTHALNFHINKSGSVVFLGACHQQGTGETGRQATAITYAEQEAFEPKFRKVLDQIGQVLHAEGYYGPAGADIMEHPDKGTLFVIDLNVRTPLSLILYLLRGHFTKRGLEMSKAFECTMMTIPRGEFEKKFAKEFEEARIIIMGSAKMGEKDQWAYGLIVAGEDQKAIDDLFDRILEYETTDATADADA